MDRLYQFSQRKRVDGVASVLFMIAGRATLVGFLVMPR